MAVGIQKVLKQWLKKNPWPTEGGVRVGPSTCGLEGCRQRHAYARSVKKKTRRGEGYVFWTFERPCDRHAPNGTDKQRRFA